MIAHNEFDRALKRAHDAGLVVCAKGWLRTDGTRIIGISSKSDPNITVHMVQVRDLELTCDCEASRFGRYCMHRALAREFLVAERYTRSDQRIAELEAEVSRLTLQLVEHDHTTAPVVRNTAAISIFR